MSSKLGSLDALGLCKASDLLGEGSAPKSCSPAAQTAGANESNATDKSRKYASICTSIQLSASTRPFLVHRTLGQPETGASLLSPFPQASLTSQLCKLYKIDLESYSS